MVSIYLGPAGLGVIGQLSSYIVVVLGVATGSINNGVVKYIAEYTGVTNKQKEVIHASLSLTLIFTAISSIVIILLPEYWANYIFGNQYNFRSVILLFGFTLIFYSLYSLSISIINGLQEYKKFNLINILSSVLGLIFTIILIHFGQLRGALYAMVTYQSLSFVIALFVLKDFREIKFNQLFKFKNKRIYLGLLGFSLMSLTTTITTPLVQIYIRTHLSESLSTTVTGFYEGMSRVSMLYLTLITTTLSVYYLPKLSVLTDKGLLKKEIINGYKLILPVLAIMTITIFFTRNWLIQLAFTSDFLPMESYFLPQLIGDFFKISSWLLAFLMLAKAMVKLFIITEIVFAILLILFTRYFVSIYGGEGAMIAYCINYIIYFFTMLVVARNFFKSSKV